MKRLLSDYGLYIAWLLACIATAGSLYFSEVRHFIPCTLCWYQRILMYPPVILLGIAAYRSDKGIIGYVLPLSLLGMLVSSYHYLEQKVAGFGAPALCSVGVPCNVSYIDWFGFVTIPLLALTAFSLISLLLFALRLQRNRAAVATQPDST